jgi:hypothetical protein
MSTCDYNCLQGAELRGKDFSPQKLTVSAKYPTFIQPEYRDFNFLKRRVSKCGDDLDDGGISETSDNIYTTISVTSQKIVTL